MSRFPETRLQDLSAEDRALVTRASEQRKHAYAPYSQFTVGSAARARDRAIYVGSNMENISYGLTMCAEVGALSAAVAAGNFAIEAIAVVGGHQGQQGDLLVTPCGRCRQLILEAAHVVGGALQVLSCSGDLEHIVVTPIEELIPLGFGPLSLRR
jgi:cytidine deaminase